MSIFSSVCSSLKMPPRQHKLKVRKQLLSMPSSWMQEFSLSKRMPMIFYSTLELFITGARSTHFSDLGEFRRSQNWIGGTSPANALFVPPTVDGMHSALNDFEK